MDIPFAALPSVLQALIILGAIAAALGALWRYVLRPVGKTFLAVHETLEMVREDHQRVAVVEERSAQLVNNSGSSLKDAVDRIEAAQGAMTQSFNDELLKIWQNLASRDTVAAAVKTAEMFDTSARKG